MLDIAGVSFSYHPQKPLITDFSISVKTGDRICAIGKNGKGKTTLLRLLAGQLTQQSGEINWRAGVVPGFFEQTNIRNLVDERTVEEEIQISNPHMNRQSVRRICGSMMFSGDNALKKISVLSGGEKSRVLLGKLLVTPANLLLLDEPTHHLDMDACDALLSAIDNFPGTVIIVTHNEMFLHALSERLVIFETDSPRVFEGSYQRFLEKGGWQEEKQGEGLDQSRPVSVISRNKLTKKELRRRRSEILNNRAKTIKPIEKRIARIEEKIESQEKTLRNLNEAMQKATQSQDGDQIPKISQSLHHCQAAIEHHFEILESLTHSLEKQHRIFEKKLSEIEQTDDFKIADTSSF